MLRKTLIPALALALWDVLLAPGASLAVDTETMGLITPRDRLCVVQLSFGDGNAELVQIARGQTEPAIWIAPENSSSFSVNVVLPASGWLMMANVRRWVVCCSTSFELTAVQAIGRRSRPPVTRASTTCCD